ncbi:hypothetical protein WDJ51_15120 [Rathayibacter sp. YIM 133350]|uniref:hypothetical protein n=1 Tax=Rathayibacter sp. YIM 133350 TaxID=3131992 RepID=UPI00307F76E2
MSREHDGYEQMRRVEDPYLGEEYELEEGGGVPQSDGQDAARVAEAEYGALGTGFLEGAEADKAPGPRHRRD